MRAAPLILSALLVPGFAAAAEPTFGPLPVAAAITVHNSSEAPGSVTITGHDAGGNAATWSTKLPAHAATTLDLAALAPRATGLLSVTIAATFRGYAQPLVMETGSGIVTDRAPCVTDDAAALHTAAGITATPQSRLRFESTAGSDQTPTVSVYDAATGNLIGITRAPVVPAGGTVVITGADIAAALNHSTATGFTLALAATFQGRMIHQQAAVNTVSDLTAKCAVGPDLETVRDVAAAPAPKIEKASASAITPTDNDTTSFVLQGAKWGDPAPGAAATVPWSFFDPANGASFPQSNGFPYVDSIMPVRDRIAVRQAMHLWEQAANIHYVETTDTASKLRVGYGYFGSGGTAAASFPCDACTNAGRDIVAFAREVFGGARHAEGYLLDIAAHEVGHTVGLNHDLVRSSVMGFAQRSLSPVQLKGLTEDDIAGAQALYGVNANPQKVIEDDVEGNEFTDTLLTAAAPFDGHIETPADEDWFMVTVVPGSDYYFTAAPAQNGGLTAPRLELRYIEDTQCCNWSSPLLSNNAATGGAAAVAFTAQYPGHYWLVVKGATETATGGYRVTMLQNIHPPQIVFSYAEGGTDFTAGTDTFGHLSLYNGVGTDTSASLIGQMNTPGDVDWYRFEAAAGQTYTFTVTGASGYAVQTPLAHPRLILRDDAGALIARDDTSGPNGTPLITTTATTARNLFLDVEAADNTAGGYSLAVNAVPTGGVTLVEATYPSGDLPGNLSSTAVIGPGQNLKGAIDHAGDSDWIKLRAVQDHIYAVTLKGVDGGGGTLADPVLRLRGPDGQVYGVRDDTAGTHDGALYLLQTYDQDTWLEAGAFGPQTGTYTLDVTEIPRVTAPATIYAAASAPLASDANVSVPLNGAAPGMLVPGTEGNGFRVFLTAGHTYRLAVPARTGTGDLMDLTLQLHDPFNPTVSKITATAGARAEFVFKAQNTGGYTAQVLPATPGIGGTYQVELSLDTQANVADAPTTDEAFDTPYFRTGPTLTPTAAPYSARLETRDDRDFILVQVPANTWYRVTAGTPSGSIATQPPKVYTPGTENVNGYQLATTTGGKLDPTSMYVRSPDGAPFKIVVYNDRDSAPFGDGLYTLTLTREDPK